MPTASVETVSKILINALETSIIQKKMTLLDIY